MSLLVSLLIGVLIIVVICYGISLIPMDARLRNLVYLVIAVLVLIWLLSKLGVGV
jgi:hypothetical protein